MCRNYTLSELSFAMTGCAVFRGPVYLMEALCPPVLQGRVSAAASGTCVARWSGAYSHGAGGTRSAAAAAQLDRY